MLTVYVNAPQAKVTKLKNASGDEVEKKPRQRIKSEQGCQFGAISGSNGSFYIVKMYILPLKLFQTGNPESQ